MTQERKDELYDQMIAWICEHVSTAMYKAERKEGLSLDARHEIFATALEGKEITFDEGEDESPDLQM